MRCAFLIYDAFFWYQVRTVRTTGTTGTTHGISGRRRYISYVPAYLVLCIHLFVSPRFSGIVQFITVSVAYFIFVLLPRHPEDILIFYTSSSSYRSLLSTPRPLYCYILLLLLYLAPSAFPAAHEVTAECANPRSLLPGYHLLFYYTQDFSVYTTTPDLDLHHSFSTLLARGVPL